MNLLVEKNGPIVTITMNRPEARNAFDLEMLVRLADAWDLVDGDDDVRVAILTGAGGHFCAGSDLKAMAGGRREDQWGEGPRRAGGLPPGSFGGGPDGEGGSRPPLDQWSARFAKEPELHWKALLRHYRLRKPLIAAVEGYAVAGGTEILQSTDVRVAGQSAKFGITEPRWGLFPLGGSTVRLRRQIPYPVAMEMLLTGRIVPADEAARIGLVGRVVPDGQTLAEARKLAEQIAANGPVAVQAIKRSVQETEGLPERDALAIELRIGQRVFESDDAKEGPRAFAEKRAPQFRGR